jgi:site-specific DNA recombinase
LQQDQKVNEKYDTIALEKRKNSLEKGQSRLIDSYAEGLIDKEDFEPKIRLLKSKIQQINQQIEASQHHKVNQMELFLVVVG